MVSGRFAFQGLSEYLTWQKIKQIDYAFPDGFDQEAKDLVQKLLVNSAVPTHTGLYSFSLLRYAILQHG
jgi:hypothetical protein